MSLGERRAFSYRLVVLFQSGHSLNIEDKRDQALFVRFQVNRERHGFYAPNTYKISRGLVHIFMGDV